MVRWQRGEAGSGRGNELQGGVGGEEQMGKGKKRGRDGRRNGKTIRVLRRCENLRFLSQRAYLLKLEMEKKCYLWGSF